MKKVNYSLQHLATVFQPNDIESDINPGIVYSVDKVIKNPSHR